MDDLIEPVAAAEGQRSRRQPRGGGVGELRPRACPDHRPVTRQDLGGAVEDLVAAITERVAQAETGLDRAAIEEIVAGFASTRSRIRRLAHALADRPAVLTDGRSPAPVAAGDLLIALRAAGATALSAPVCATAGCGKQLAALQRRGQDWYCSGCYHAGTERAVRWLRPDANGRHPGPRRCSRGARAASRETAVTQPTSWSRSSWASTPVWTAAWSRRPWDRRPGSRVSVTGWPAPSGQRPDLLTGAGAAAPERCGAAAHRPAGRRRGDADRPARLPAVRRGEAAAEQTRRHIHLLGLSFRGRRRGLQPLRSPPLSAVRDAAGAPVCSGCRARDPGNLEPCTGCGQLRPRHRPDR